MIYVVIILLIVLYVLYLFWPIPDGNPSCHNPYYYDKTQFLYTSLKNIFDELTKGEKRFLFGDCKREEYTRLTIDNIMKIDLDEIMDNVLKRVNDNPLFNFKLLAYENVIIIRDCHENRRYIIDVLVSDIRTFFGLRLKVDAVKFGVVQTESESTPNCALFTSAAFRRYYGGYPTLEQMIPLPTQVVTTGNMVVGEFGKETIIPVQARYLHLNSIAIENSNLTLDIANKCNTTCSAEGIQDTSLEYGFETKRKCGNRVGTEYYTKENAWPKLEEEPKNFITMEPPPRRVVWDCNGVNCTTKQYLPKQPNFWRANFATPRNAGEYMWLFDLARSVQREGIQ